MCEMGFKVGCWVERKKDKVQASVVALSDDNVKMQCDDGQMYDVSSMAFLEGQFKLMKQPKAQPKRRRKGDTTQAGHGGLRPRDPAKREPLTKIPTGQTTSMQTHGVWSKH